MSLSYACGFCPLRFPTKTARDLHVAHEHPLQTDSSAYFSALVRKYERR